MTRTVGIRYGERIAVTIPERWIESWPVFRYRPPFFFDGKRLLPFLWVANDNV